MGVFIGLPILLVGLTMPGVKTYLTRCLLAYGVATLTALGVGLAALAIATATIHEHSLPWPAVLIPWALQASYLISGRFRAIFPNW